MTRLPLTSDYVAFKRPPKYHLFTKISLTLVPKLGNSSPISHRLPEKHKKMPNTSCASISSFLSENEDDT